MFAARAQAILKNQVECKVTLLRAGFSRLIQVQMLVEVHTDPGLI